MGQKLQAATKSQNKRATSTKVKGYILHMQSHPSRPRQSADIQRPIPSKSSLKLLTSLTAKLGLSITIMDDSVKLQVDVR